MTNQSSQAIAGKPFKKFLRDFIDIYGDQVSRYLINELNVEELSEHEMLSKMLREGLGMERVEVDLEKDKAIITLTGCVRHPPDEAYFERSYTCLIQIFGACIIEKVLGIRVENVGSSVFADKCVLRFTLGETI